jgi:hypothetical protein
VRWFFAVRDRQDTELHDFFKDGSVFALEIGGYHRTEGTQDGTANQYP